MSGRRIAAWLVVLMAAVSCPLWADEDSKQSPLVVAGWCAVHGDKRDADAPGCDIGMGLLLWHSKRAPQLGMAAAVGTETVGAGMTWAIADSGGHPMAVSLGVIAPYDKLGIDVGRWAVALGATFGFGERE